MCLDKMSVKVIFFIEFVMLIKFYFRWNCTVLVWEEEVELIYFVFWKNWEKIKKKCNICIMIVKRKSLIYIVKIFYSVVSVIINFF